MTDEIGGADRSNLANEPIFILGILPRCGTNFLSDLLCLHPDCGQPAPIWEDFLLAHTDMLDTYVNSTTERWDPAWGYGDAARNNMARALGDGLISFLQSRTDARRVVTKTPRVENLERFFRYFPNARLLIVVRDGRAILESGIKTFGWHRDAALHRLAAAAKRILAFDKRCSDPPRRDAYRIIRYEDLWSNLDDELTAILAFVGLDTSRYDFSAAANLPIRGSSTVRREANDAIHWDPVQRTEAFDPMSRCEHWTRAQHERFNKVAGRSFEAFGYQLKRYGGARLMWAMWNVLLDVKWHVVRALGPVAHRIKKALR